MRTRTSLLLFLVLAFGFSSAAQSLEQASRVEQNLRKHIEYLASDRREGRRTGEPGATAAANYVAKEFKNGRLKLGLKTGYLQPFPYISGVTLGTDNSLRIVPADPTREHKMETGINWIPLGYSPNADIPSTAIVFAGFGVTAPEANYDDYAGLDVKDKIVLIFDDTPDAGNPHSAFARFDIHTKANIAKDKGAKAIILIAADNDFKNDRVARLTYDRTLGETALPIVGILRGFGAELIGAAGEAEMAAIAEWLAKKTNAPPFKTMQATAQIRINLVKKRVDAYNVIGMLEGSDPVLKNEAIIIGAHYDHLGHGGSGSLAANSTEIHHGADDNASGTAAVIELARAFAKEKKNKRTLIFIAFSGEEEGLLGSKFYVTNPIWPLERTIAMINMDMVGRLNENKLTVGGVGTANEWRDLIANSNKTVLVSTTHVFGPGSISPPASTQPGPNKFALQLNDDGFGPSDHSSFYGKQIPVLFLFTGTHLDYHKPSDTADKINYTGLLKVTDFAGILAAQIDENPARPTYAVAKSSGSMGQVRLAVSLGTIPSYGDTTDGMILDGVRDNSPASRAGLKAGDKIVKLAGKGVRNAMDYTYVLGSMKPGQEYEVEIIRGTERMTLKVIPAPAARRP